MNAVSMLASIQLKQCNNNVSTAKGFTLIEMVVVIAIISILTGLLMNRVWFYQEQAEKAAMEQVAGAVQTALVLQYGQMMAQGKGYEAKMLLNENPLQWLMKPPENFSGEPFSLTTENIKPGNWAFELRTRQLVYAPYHAENLKKGNDGNKWIRYRVRLEYDKTSRESQGRRAIAGVLFETIEPYQWLTKLE